MKSVSSTKQRVIKLKTTPKLKAIATGRKTNGGMACAEIYSLPDEMFIPAEWEASIQTECSVYPIDAFIDRLFWYKRGIAHPVLVQCNNIMSYVYKYVPEALPMLRKIVNNSPLFLDILAHDIDFEDNSIPNVIKDNPIRELHSLCAPLCRPQAEFMAKSIKLGTLEKMHNVNSHILDFVLYLVTITCKSQYSSLGYTIMPKAEEKIDTSILTHDDAWLKLYNTEAYALFTVKTEEGICDTMFSFGVNAPKGSSDERVFSIWLTPSTNFVDFSMRIDYMPSDKKNCMVLMQNNGHRTVIKLDEQPDSEKWRKLYGIINHVFRLARQYVDDVIPTTQFEHNTYYTEHEIYSKTNAQHILTGYYARKHYSTLPPTQFVLEGNTKPDLHWNHRKYTKELQAKHAGDITMEVYADWVSGILNVKREYLLDMSNQLNGSNTAT